ncbi:MAG: GlxA family transcriptional regulator, partial [Rhodospirillaceae bacterium]|nr:GlxA family transcriptional regulator [Rhodospirillaceae bacterium]
MTIGFLLMPLFSMMAFVSAVEPLRVANRMAERQLYRWEVLSRDGNPVTASNNMSLAADHAISKHPSYPMVVICASFNPL